MVFPQLFRFKTSGGASPAVPSPQPTPTIALATTAVAEPIPITYRGRDDSDYNTKDAVAADVAGHKGVRIIAVDSQPQQHQQEPSVAMAVTSVADKGPSSVAAMPGSTTSMDASTRRHPSEVLEPFLSESGRLVRLAHWAGRCVGGTVSKTILPSDIRSRDRSDLNAKDTILATACDVGGSVTLAGAHVVGSLHTARKTFLKETLASIKETAASTGIPLAGPIVGLGTRFVDGIIDEVLGTKAAFVMGAATAAFAPPVKPLVNLPMTERRPLPYIGVELDI